jgi:Rrf2 family iron-sulfur cluster assembly transcriptional regulator
MRLTQRNYTAILALRELAKSSRRKQLSLTELAARLTVSKSYLEQIFARLRRHGMVRGTRGTGGGYILAQPLADISLAAVLLASDPPTPARTFSAYADLRTELDKRLRHSLGGIPLADLYQTLPEVEPRTRVEQDRAAQTTVARTAADATSTVAPTNGKLRAA